MNAFRDVMLELPLGEVWMRALLMLTFMLHLLFVLLTLGTAFLGTALVVAGHAGGRLYLRRWGEHIFRSFFVHKSLAIVLGVAPILLMQVGNTIPFMTATNLFTPLWLMLVVLLVTALLLFELIEMRWINRPAMVYLASGLGLFCLLLVPSTFAIMVVTTENPSRWAAMFAREGRLPLDLAVHWFLRVLHIAIAGAIFTAGFHYLFTRQKRKRYLLITWMAWALAAQLVAGVALYASLPRFPQAMVAVVILTGVTLAVILLLRIQRMRWEQILPQPTSVAVFSVGILTAMLLGRQLLQDQVLIPVAVQLKANRDHYRAATLRAAGDRGRDPISASQSISYGDPSTMYFRSCGFCHGAVGNGAGDAAPRLFVPPEDLTGLVLGDEKFHRILIDGVDHTAMPRFGYYTRDELERLMAFVRSRMGTARQPDAIPFELTDQNRAAATEVFDATCVICHGEDGRGSDVGLRLRPAPPDLTKLSLKSAREFDIITNGYPGTDMNSFAYLPEATRWALVEKVHGFYQSPPVEQAEKPTREE